MTDYDDHEHRYYMQPKTYTEFTPNLEYIDLYERVEYALLACNCGDVIRKQVRDE